MTLVQILLFGGVASLQSKVTEHSKTLQSPDEDDFDYNADDDDDPGDYSVGQFLGDDDDAFVQVGSKKKIKHSVLARKHAFMARKSNGPDDEDYDFAEDDDDDPGNFSVDQFLGDDGDSFIQTNVRSDDDDDYADDRLGAGEFVLTSDAQEEAAAADDDEEEPEEDDSVHQVLLQEARKHHKHHQKDSKSKKPLKSLLGVTDIYQQFAIYEKDHHDDEADTQGWEAIDADDDNDEDASFIQTKKKAHDDNDGDDEDDDLADDRLDGGMDQIIAAEA